jgi:tRNA pseudouridine38-40 synthase
VERYKVIVAYDGTEFAGFQFQAGVRTIQGVIEEALRGLDWKGAHLLAAGRTDTGVHALGQVVAFDLAWPHPPEALAMALNARLPGSVRCRDVEPAAKEFHPRYSARQRTYRYRIIESRQADPLGERYAWRIWPMLEHGSLRRASAAIVGRKDFAAFGRPPHHNGKTVRHVMQADWRRVEDQLEFTIQADAFLYRMVRMLVGSLVRVGQGRLAEADFLDLLMQPAAGRGGPAAPAKGLCLMRIDYAAPDGLEAQPPPAGALSETM